MIARIKSAVKTFHRDEVGEMPIGPILLIALIVIPLVFFLITFRDNILEFFTNAIETLFGEAEEGNEPEAPEL